MGMLETGKGLWVLIPFSDAKRMFSFDEMNAWLRIVKTAAWFLIYWFEDVSIAVGEPSCSCFGLMCAASSMARS